ncbi:MULTISPECIES: DUF262 domain-containing protein [unclassified Arthrobacter]|uniref:DUF262 domain-containing protein n=1 Tax=unclassified Arthrobacter TaxID=235627 RepID=UPI001E3C5CEC|nr:MULTISPECIES: DUF262 domain-containing protein [unclassified Arthrobacter]MCC9145209.1 DUF262 domain-containing HNH endonuclease family protein [Arthrobacter sp. zg-Y919]MDK1276437.1 DUF262 domain-containing HNH endonuclease family protein [Arthrobacter sp. zg.Y919]WIB01963.1 DUF262 domain-containing HNH endonuclease family protein [Arthrobacter sp. zg-Y919]
MNTELPKIVVGAKTFQDCFSDCIYEVPKFQRPYSWEKEQLQDYWTDVIGARGDLFFGTIVTWVSTKRDLFRDTYSLIDGQQRLTTSAIALSVVRDALDAMAEGITDNKGSTNSTQRMAKNLATASQRYLVAEDDYGEEFAIVIRPESMFWDVIQKPNTIPSNAQWDESARRIGQARAFFEQKIGESLTEAETEQDALDRLTEIRSSILRARLIQVELQKEEDAFLIFETLNTRGADLQLRDLVKNDLVRGISTNRQDRNNVVQRWESIMNHVVATDSAIDAADSFIWQSWNSRREAVRQNELYKSLRNILKTDPEKHLTYLSELEVDARTFTFLEGNSVNFPAEVRGTRSALSIPAVQDSLVALNVFNVSVANSAVMALIRVYDSTRFISRKSLINTLRAIENFHFQFTQLASSSSTGGTRQRYNTFAVQLERARSTATATLAINGLIERLRESTPDAVKLTSAFEKLFYAPSLRLNQSQKKRGRQDVIRYVLLTLARHDNTVARSRTTSDWTIEHIRPQAGAEANINDPAFSIGNLTLLTSAANGNVADGNFAAKREKLRTASALKDPVLESWIDDAGVVELSDEAIAHRAASLARHAISSVWAI